MKKIRLILGGMLFILLFYCINPMLLRLCERGYMILHDLNLQIEIENVSAESYTELWLAQMSTDTYSLENAVDIIGGITGIWNTGLPRNMAMLLTFWCRMVIM